MKHEIKCWPEHFRVSWCGDKLFEIRKDDRNYQERDEVVLQEYDPVKREYTGREIEGWITYVTDFEQKPGFVVFGYNERCRTET